MQAVDEKQETVTFRGKSRDETGMKRVEKVEVPNTREMETLKHIEKKLIDKGVHRKDRHPIDGFPLDHQRKSGHGGKYTWEGPADQAATELEGGPAVLEESDPNYVDEEAEGRILRGEVSGVEDRHVGFLCLKVRVMETDLLKNRLPRGPVHPPAITNWILSMRTSFIIFRRMK